MKPSFSGADQQQRSKRCLQQEEGPGDARVGVDRAGSKDNKTEMIKA